MYGSCGQPPASRHRGRAPSTAVCHGAGASRASSTQEASWHRCEGLGGSQLFTPWPRPQGPVGAPLLTLCPVPTQPLHPIDRIETLELPSQVILLPTSVPLTVQLSRPHLSLANTYFSTKTESKNHFGFNAPLPGFTAVGTLAPLDGSSQGHR